MTQQNSYNGKIIIKQWNHDLKHPKMPNLDTTQKLLHPYSKVTHANINQNSQLELCHSPFSDIHLHN
jgi:hypothetical protein